MTRKQLILVSLLCVTLSPILMLSLLLQAAFGSEARAKGMELALDCCGNALFGGAFNQTISERTGNALIEGRPWAKYAAAVIDFMFGQGHCLANATIKKTVL